MKKYPFGSLTVTVGSPTWIVGFYAQINRYGKTKTFYDPPERVQQRLLRCLAGLPAFGDTDTLTIETTADEFLAGINLLVDPLKAQIALLREVLEAVEWEKDEDGYFICPWCRSYKNYNDYHGHAPYCLRQRALEETK